MALRMTEAAAREVERLFDRTSRELDGVRHDFRDVAPPLVVGAGEFADVIEDEARHFRDSWRAVFDVYADSASVIAGNTNVQYLDLLNIDRAND